VFASTSPNAYKTGDKVRVRLRRDDVRFVAGEVLIAGVHTCLVNTDDGPITVPTGPQWLRKLALVKTRPQSLTQPQPRGAA
jgi:hypothetical protein